MSTTPIDDGGPAFPVPGNDTRAAAQSCYGMVGHPGMSLRDWLAGMALSEWIRAHIEQTVDDLDKPSIACECYSYADAMIAARKGGAK